MSWRPLSRRGVIRRGVAGLATLAGAEARAQTVETQDRGLGGTGAAPSDRAGEDRGIGGTGVIGTIRRFGSIVVNDLRVAYPPDVAVTIDGHVAAVTDLRLGHVVEVLASTRRGRLMTARIAVIHEVVGPIEAIGHQGLRVLGQHVSLVENGLSPEWREGQVVAVSGLRRPDDVIVASLVEPRRADALRVMGIVEPGRDGAARIGGLLLGKTAQLRPGTRVALSGRLHEGRFEIASVERPAEVLAAQRPARLSIEAYVVRRSGRLHLSTGFDITGTVTARAIPDHETVRAVVIAHLDRAGGWRLDGLRMAARPHDRGSRDQSRGPGLGPGRPAGRPEQGPAGHAPGGAGPSGAPSGAGATPGGARSGRSGNGPGRS